jgi:hypothetical protein
MATTTPNYGWDVPTSTDYVKDGATAIETLGDDIDASLFSITTGRNVGMVLINTTSFSAVSSQSINDVFSTTFDNYRVVLKLNGTSTGLILARLRVSGADASGVNYEQQGVRIRSGVIANPNGVGTGSAFHVLDVQANVAKNGVSFDVISPFLAENTQFLSTGFDWAQNDQSAEFRAGNHNLSTSYTGITLLPQGGTITGTVSIYGYRK